MRSRPAENRHDQIPGEGRQGELEDQPRPNARDGGEEADERNAHQGPQVSASADNPEFIVKSDKSGKQAAHKADALTKTS
jgi:hypothetical protein